MSASRSFRTQLQSILGGHAIRHLHHFTPPVLRTLLHAVVQHPSLAIVVDVDTLERSALAKIDRVILLALDALARAGVLVVLAARRERNQAELLQHSLPGARVVDGGDDALIARIREERPGTACVVITDDPDLLGSLGAEDRGIALGRPELVRRNVASTGDTAVRATLWWILEERTEASS